MSTIIKTYGNMLLSSLGNTLLLTLLALIFAMIIGLIFALMNVGKNRVFNFIGTVYVDAVISYPRHEYFRRTLCNVLGNDIENGMIPYTGYEKARVQQMVEDICYNNAKNYFKF